MNKIITKIMNYNPYAPIAILLGYLFWPLTKVKYISDNIKPLVKLINNLFINSSSARFLAIWYPLIFIGILPNVGAAQFMVFNIGSFIPMVIGVQVLPSILLNLKNSSLLKRIGATETQPVHLSIAFIFYFSLVSIISIFFNVGLGIVFYKSQLYLEYVNWGQLIFSYAVGMLIALSAGMFISGILKTPQTAQVIGLLLTLPAAFLTGQFLPPNLVNDWGAVRYISFVFPQGITTVLTQTAVNGGDIFALPGSLGYYEGLDYSRLSSIKSWVENTDNNIEWSDFHVKDYEELLTSKSVMFDLTNKAELIMCWTLAPLYVGSFIGLTSKTFKWGVR